MIVDNKVWLVGGRTIDDNLIVEVDVSGFLSFFFYFSTRISNIFLLGI